MPATWPVSTASRARASDPDELTTEECKALIDQFEAMQIFYVNIGGGEPTIRSDFWELVDYATSHHVGVKFATNGSRITAEVADRLAASDYVDVQISLTAPPRRSMTPCGAPAPTTRLGRHGTSRRAGFTGFKLSVVVTRHNISQLDDFKRLADDTMPSCASPGCARPDGGPTSGTSSIRPPINRGSSTTGWSPTARTC